MQASTLVFAVRVLKQNGSGKTSHIVCGIDWVTANAATLGIRVANMSLGEEINARKADDGNCGRSNGNAMHLAICNSVAAGVTFVVGAGNAGIDLSQAIPAGYSEVLTVTAMSDFDGQPGKLGTSPAPAWCGPTGCFVCNARPIHG